MGVPSGPQGLGGGATWVFRQRRESRRQAARPCSCDGRAVRARSAAFLIGWFTGAVAQWPERDRDDLGRLLARFADAVTAQLAQPDGTPSTGH